MNQILKDAIGFIVYTEEMVEQGKWDENGDLVDVRRKVGCASLAKIVKETNESISNR